MMILSNTRNCRRQRAGITLLEVLVALAIFLISLAAISQLVEYASDNALRARYQNTASRLAASKMAEVEAGVIAVSTSSGGDFTEEGDPNWNWEVDTYASEVANLYNVTVRVYRQLRGANFEVVITQSVFDPNVIGAGNEAQPPLPTGTTSTQGTGGTP